MSEFGDLVTAVLAREFVSAHAEDDVRVIAVTTTSTLVAALAARRLGAEVLAIAPGFATLDAAPRPALSLGETALRAAASPKGSHHRYVRGGVPRVCRSGGHAGAARSSRSHQSLLRRR